MTRRVKLARIVGAIMGAAVFLIALGDQSSAALVYQQNFDSGNGTPAITPGGGVLGVTTPALFSASGGVFGGSLDASGNANNSTADVGGAGTSAVYVGGTGITGLPDQTGGGTGSMNQFTISFWYNTSTFRTASSSVTHRLLTFGDSTAPDVSASPGVGFLLRNDGTGSGGAPNRKAIGVNVNGIDISAAGAGSGFEGTAATVGTWTFVALTYDGTSALGNNSTLQNTQTGGASSVNGQLYWGTNALSVTRFDAPVTSTAGDATAASLGAINFGNAAVMILANNATPNRSFDGLMDDVRIYDGVLSAADIEAVRLQGLTAVPEPASLMLVGFGVFAAAGLRRRGAKVA